MTDEEWVALIVRNINNGMPVIYSAGTEPAATYTSESESDFSVGTIRHAFVIDGIKRDVNTNMVISFILMVDKALI